MAYEALETVGISVRVNNSDVRQTVEARETLAEFIRNRLGLTGTKLSCELQVCGVCTVLVDSEPVSSCTYLAADADGRAVQTVEGLSNGEQMHELQEAFVTNFASQCGFCTPGFLMMSKALLDRTERPTRDEVVEHLNGAICRCTGYRPIVDAVMEVVESRGGGQGA